MVTLKMTVKRSFKALPALPAKNNLPKYELADEEETKEVEQFMDEQRRLKERKAAEKKARRTEINRKIAEEKKKRKIENDKQLSLFDDFNA